jgi:hypothetical protein
VVCDAVDAATVATFAAIDMLVEGAVALLVRIVAVEAGQCRVEPAVRPTIEDLDGLVDQPVMGAVAIAVVRPAGVEAGATRAPARDAITARRAVRFRRRRGSLATLRA